jgi:hypothetical protein
MRVVPVLSILGCVSLLGCGPVETGGGIGCGAPAEPLPRASVSIEDDELSFEAECLVETTSYADGLAHVDLDCGLETFSLDVPANRAPMIAGEMVTLKIDKTVDSLDLRVVDELGPIIVVLDGVVEPGVEGQLGWQLETNCSDHAGLVAAHLVVRLTPESLELRVDVGDVEHVEYDMSGTLLRWELRTFAAQFELEPGVATGAAAIVRTTG